MTFTLPPNRLSPLDARVASQQGSTLQEAKASYRSLCFPFNRMSQSVKSQGFGDWSPRPTTFQISLFPVDSEHSRYRQS